MGTVTVMMNCGSTGDNQKKEVKRVEKESEQTSKGFENDIVEDRDGGEEEVIEAPVLPQFGEGEGNCGSEAENEGDKGGDRAPTSRKG